MPSYYYPDASYRQDHDVRAWDRLIDRIEHQGPSGVMWPIVGPRRSGKTWALKALQARLEPERDPVSLADLYADGGSGLGPVASSIRDGQLLLLDEPGFALFQPRPHKSETIFNPDRPRDDIGAFIEVLAAFCSRGVKLVMAMTPAEWSVLIRADHGRRRVNPIDIEPVLKPLTEDQALGIARDDEARSLVRALPGPWKRSPFLLTWLLHHAFDEKASHAHLEAFLWGFTQTVHDDTRFHYINRVFEEGLDDELRNALRSVGRTGRAAPDPLAVLRDAGLVVRAEDGHHDIADPILAHHLPPPFRVHHISDLHFGPNSATRADVKLGGDIGTTLGKSIGQGVVQDVYREYVATLPLRRRPHLVIISGDIAEKAREEEYHDAKAWLLRLDTALVRHPRSRPSEPRIMLVGGNHDVDWNQARTARDRHQPFADAFEGIPGVTIAPLDELPGHPSRPSRHRFVDIGLDVLLLGSAEHGGELDAELLTLLDITEQLRNRALAAGTAVDPVEIDGLRKRYGRFDPGLIHHDDLVKVRSMELQGAVGIAVLHHPVSPLPSVKEIAPLGGLLNAGQVKDALLHAGFHLVLHGHAHSAWIGSERWPGQHDGRTLHIVAAPTLSSYETVESHGYNELCIHLEEDGARVDVTLYERKGDSFHSVHHAEALVTVAAPR